MNRVQILDMHYGIFVCENSKSGLGIKSDLLLQTFPHQTRSDLHSKYTRKGKD